MVKVIELENFQCHKKLRLSFSDVTTIVGPTDRGKSAILRALYWVLFNKPGGDSFISWGKKHVRVTVTLSNGTIVERYRSASENKYVLNGVDLKSFGASVPDPVQKALKVDFINFQQQHDAHFWFSLSPGEVSRRLNDIVNLSIIDHSLASISSAVRKTRVEADLFNTRFEEACKERRSIKRMSGMIDRFYNIEKLEQRLEKRKELLDSLSDTISQVTSLRNQILALTDMLKNAPDPFADDQCRVLREKISNLTHVIGTVDQLTETIQESENMASAPLWKKGEHLLELDDDVHSLTKHLNSIEEREEKVCRENKVSKRIRKELDKLTENGCPLCGAKMS